MAELLSRPTPEGVLGAGLAQAARLLSVGEGPGGVMGAGEAVKGLGLLQRGRDVPAQVAAVYGYPTSLIGLHLNGPWSVSRVRVLPDGAHELYATNAPEVQTQLDAAGMRGTGASISLPLTDRGRPLGALLLDRGGGQITPAQQEAAARLSVALGGLLGLVDSRDEWRATARGIALTVVEAVESREFDALGHAREVAELAVRLGRALGLSEREQEELWYAATLHDLGKLHGESGHALVGANFLHGMPQLSTAMRAVRHHHERWDGQGEPDKLAGEDIPLYARLLAVANTYVRVGSLEAVQAQAGRALDPRLVGLLERLLEAGTPAVGSQLGGPESPAGPGGPGDLAGAAPTDGSGHAAEPADPTP